MIIIRHPYLRTTRFSVKIV